MRYDDGELFTGSERGGWGRAEDTLRDRGLASGRCERGADMMAGLPDPNKQSRGAQLASKDLEKFPENGNDANERR